MKQKSILWSLLTMMMVAVMSASFIACSDDDDDSSGSGVVGTWSGQEGKHYLTLTFKKDGSGTWTSRYNDSYSGYETERGTFSYEMEGKSKGIITVRDYDSYSGYHTENIFFEIEGKKMYLFEDYYGEDLEWILTKE